MDLVTNVIIFVTQLYTKLYGDVYKGYYKNNTYYKPMFLENYMYLLPSYFNHLYGKIFNINYLYQKNNLLYLSNIKESIQLIPPVLSFNINNIESKNLVTGFSNNIPFKYIFMYYGVLLPTSINYKYIKSGVQIKEINSNEILEKSLTDILN
ncbi:hypothetical protein crov221 [Cafeteria roenbergensis virus]|uniref:Uncharacterized protein n=1 Tax=Cafeteria roenbergensis virus (strain BV-PW1) TaxID=693272 RepID=E3T4Z1_CROVB|nr:hypothetical protein crov221 [Cafeteria roenbergensis virus BV-PW1]ADO67254.1 hypothetical protein crov221 [Cafeteria roenbergensis virus BV-PW1]